MDNPLVSVIVPTRNSAATIGECLASVRQQTYKDIELIIVDNASTTDATRTIAARYSNRVLVHGPERNQQRNYAAKEAKGAYLLFIDSDMTLDPRVVEACVTLMRERHPAGIVIPEESYGLGFWAQCKKLERSFYLGVPWIEAPRFIAAQTFHAVGGYNERLISGEDWLMRQELERVGDIGRIAPFIYHNEGSPTLRSIVRKKFFYSEHINQYFYASKNTDAQKRQRSVIQRFALYFGQPVKLFRNPILGMGMLAMKLLEFTAGFVKLVRLKICSPVRDASS